MVVELMGFHDKAVNVYRTKNYIVVQKYTLEFDENDELCSFSKDLFIERTEGKVVFYNDERMFGSIEQFDQDNLFFRQADYIFDEIVEKYDIVEYSIIKTYDMKKQQATYKAILLKTLEEGNSYQY